MWYQLATLLWVEFLADFFHMAELDSRNSKICPVGLLLPEYPPTFSR